MELRRLRYFLRVCIDGSLGRASRSLGIAQPALGRQIQLLESELGVKLFRRMPKGMRLTEEGEFLMDALDHPLKQIDTALRSVRSHGARIETAFALGLPPPIASLLGPRLFTRLRDEVPNLRLRLVEDHSASLAADLRKGQVDIAILVGVTPDGSVFQAEVLREDLMLVGAAGSDIASAGPIPVEELHRYPLIMPGRLDGIPTRLEKALAGIAGGLQIVSEVDSLEIAKQVVADGGAFTVLPPVSFREEEKAGLLCGTPIAPAIEQSALYAVQPHWRVRRETYNEVERVIFAVWTDTVQSGEWPARWLFDHRKLSTYAAPA